MGIGLIILGLAIGTLLGFGIFALQQRRKKVVPQKNTSPQRRQEMTQEKPTMPTITSMSDLRLFFHRNTRPIYFISATNFNLAGMDERVPHFKHINYIDCYDGRHPNVFVPSEQPHPEFEGIEDQRCPACISSRSRHATHEAAAVVLYADNGIIQ
ncbi:MAG: hypothetical protein XXXNARYT_000133 [Candidatus Accumulibacter regalis]